MKITSADFITSAAKASQYPPAKYDEIVLLGRSNVGKSTFINSITNNKKLAYISSKPGKTQVINFFLLNSNFCLVDVPGYGYAKVSKKQREQFGKMIEEYLTTRATLRLVILLVDFKVGPTEDDILMYDFLQHFHINTLVVATKMDKVNKSHQYKQIQKIQNDFTNINQERVIPYSKNDLKTLEPVLKQIEEVIDNG